MQSLSDVCLFKDYFLFVVFSTLFFVEKVFVDFPNLPMYNYFKQIRFYLYVMVDPVEFVICIERSKEETVVCYGV